jgi:hypothetical protein
LAFLVQSVGTGVTSSILPILIPLLAMALKAVMHPGPGALASTPKKLYKKKKIKKSILC